MREYNRNRMVHKEMRREAKRGRPLWLAARRLKEEGRKEAKESRGRKYGVEEAENPKAGGHLLLHRRDFRSLPVPQS